MTTSVPVLTRLGALGVAAVMAASCTRETGGTAHPQRSGSSTSAVAAGPLTPTGSPAPSASPSASDQIRETLMAFQDAYNTQNWDAYLELMCAPMRAKFTGTAMNYVKKGRAQNGVTTVKSITSITITGDTATVSFEGQSEALGTGTITLPFKLEDGWKVCKP